MKNSSTTPWSRCLFSLCALLGAGFSLGAGAPEEAKQIASLANFRGGLVVQVGCGDGQLTAALRLEGNCVVQGLDTDAKRVEAARTVIQAAGVYGPVSVAQWDGKHLPYVDNLATLVVCEDAKAVASGELLRVVRPYGAVVVKKGGKWEVSIKPKQPGTDEWEQHYHGADNNSVANDSVVGAPRHYQWLGEPEWQRSHLAMPSINSMVSSKGRLFTIEDVASAEHPALPGKQVLMARDAFSGIALWSVKFPDWHPTLIRDKETPIQIQRRLVALADLVYCTPGYSAPITVFDAATGVAVKKFENTSNTMEFVHDQGVLYAVTGDQFDVSENLSDLSPRSAMNSSVFKRSAYGPLIRKATHPRNEILAIDAASGKELWRIANLNDYEGASIGVSGDRVVYATAKDLICADRKTGKTLWQVPAPITLEGPNGIAVSLVLSDKAVFLGDSARLRAFRLADGKALWAHPVTINHHKAPDVFLANNLVWAASYDASVGKPNPAAGLPEMGVNGFDPETGKIVTHLKQTMDGPMGHDRCYRNRITTRYYINSATGGSDFLGLSGGAEIPDPWIRSTCGIGPLPCNGLYYAGPPSCACCNGVMLNGMNVLAGEPNLSKANQPIKVTPDGALQKGPAFADAATLKAEVSADDWPAYRHDNARTGTTKNKVSPTLVKRWETKIGKRPSAPVIAGGMVFAADVDGHAVCALKLADGKVAWRVTTEARVDSPPTYYQGLLLFGSRDGTAYCVRASDGALVWRFSPLEKRTICAYGQPESAWPICGSILIRGDLAYFAAGRNSFIDGGIFLYAVEPRTGKMVHQQHVYGPFGENGFPIQNKEVVSGMSIEGFKNDIFIADDQLLYLRHQAFQPDLAGVRLQDVKKPHLIPSHGFLEAIPQHRSFWTIDTMLHYDIATGMGGIHGDILVIDGAKFYEVRGYTPGRTEWFDPRTAGYTLFAGTYGDPTVAVESRKAARQAKAKQAAAAQSKQQTKRAGKKASAKNGDVSLIAPSNKLWTSTIPVTGKAMVLANDVIFVAGTPVVFPEDDLGKAYEGRMGGILIAASTADGKKLAEYKLDAAPAWDTLAAANGLLFFALADGRVVCMGPQ